MGCCPWLRRSQKIIDIYPMLQYSCQTEEVAMESHKNPDLGRGKQPSNTTELHVQIPKQHSELQSKLEISIFNQSSNREENQCLEHLLEPKVNLIGQSNLRESLIYRWEEPQFKIQELFLAVDFDRLFKSD